MLIKKLDILYMNLVCAVIDVLMVCNVLSHKRGAARRKKIMSENYASVLCCCSLMKEPYSEFSVKSFMYIV